MEGAGPGGDAPSEEAGDWEIATYMVVRNGTLTRIARVHGVPLLIKVNPQIQNPDLIYVGDVVRIPVREIA